MDTPPAPATDTHDQHIIDLRAAIQRAMPLLSFAAGRERATPRQAGLLLAAAADDMTELLNRTAP
ncbi:MULTISPECIES: hypothetical protein [Streptomyces]|uniref:hypothetical protein n=1 Tax=Streptomyces TaxID=1883 RepID=UPI00167B8DDA|nr:MULTISPECIES: hypothetical protein [Streptomyces]MBK3523695.1 hypothetical protein [Streptomyces sp. MBT70]GGS09976.1 hypothetical protein GCM10010236_75580 [Streptomyces eurythermus]